MTSYLTLAADVVAEIEVERSRFRCLLARAATEEQARATIEQVRREHWDARHHCTAFVIGPSGALARSNDDGEPSGTAGAPMLEVLRGAGTSDVVAVTTRWFGGIKLGTGGLARAYAASVRAGLAEASLVTRSEVLRAEVAVGHALAGRLENDLRARGVTITGSSYDARVTLHLAVPPESLDDVTAIVEALTGGEASPEVTGSAWVDQG